MITLEEFKQRYEWDADVDTIGRGGYATVVRAYDKKLDRLVALKIYKTEEKGRGSLVEEFKRAMKVNHPHVLRYYDIVEVEIKPGVIVEFGITELATGGDLKKWLKSDLPIAEKERIAREILLGVKCLHDLGYVHRDLKPENILMVGEKGNYTAKIADFGLTRVNWADKTTQSHASGTLAYMAPESIFPERFSDSNRYDKTLDIWGLGIILFQLFVGTHPFKANDPKATIADVSRLIYNAAVPPTITLAPPVYQDIIQACLKQNPIGREREIDEFLIKLNKERKGQEKQSLVESEKPKQSIVEKLLEASKKPFMSQPPKQPIQQPQQKITPAYTPTPGPQPTASIPQQPAASIPRMEAAVYMDCPNCKHEFPKGKERCPHCNWIVKGPITLNYVKIGASQATTAFFVSLALVSLIGLWENDEKLRSVTNTDDHASAGINFQNPLILLIAGVGGLTIITFLGWLIRVRQNLKHFGYKQVNRGLPLQIVLLFLPLINLLVLAGMITETWQASDPQHVDPESEDWRKGSSSVWIGLFSLFLFLNIIATALFLLIKYEAFQLDSSMKELIIFASISTFLLAWLFLGIIMLAVNMRQRQKLVKIMQYTPYGKVSAGTK